MGRPGSWPLILLAAVLPLLASCGGSSKERPALIAYLVVDQLRGDLLERYDSLFTGGFRRLRDEGYRFSQVTHDHSETTTAVGHATLSTGSYPSRHGIVGNEWMERTPGAWRSVNAVEDTLRLILGHPAMEGRSPRNLLRGGLADWIMAADSGSVVVSISRKDRAAILMAGTVPGHVYWIVEREGRFVTSDYYARDYPTWVERFNAHEMPLIFSDSVWEQLVPVEARGFSRPDTAACEGDGVHTHFPHRFQDEVTRPERPGALNRWAYSQPHPDEAVAALAQEAVRSLSLGAGSATDFLALSFSQVDAVGHAYGPRSREQLDNLLRLDRLLEELMETLDTAVGEGRWVMALTADHGVMDVPEAVESGRGARISRPQVDLLRSVFDRHRGAPGDPVRVAEQVVAELERLPFVADAMTLPELMGGPPADSFVVLMRNSYHPDRWTGGYGSEGSGVAFRFPEALYPDPEPRGTGHGSPYYYDRWVPLYFVGSGVAPGASHQPVRSVDIAPTLAHLGGVAVPTDLDGKSLFQ